MHSTNVFAIVAEMHFSCEVHMSFLHVTGPLVDDKCYWLWCIERAIAPL